MKKILL